MQSNDPATEARTRLPDGYVARVLEPSPPAVIDGDWFADDAVNAPVDAGAIVSPVANADTTWSDVVADTPSLADFARDRWLAAYRPVQPFPEGYQTTMVALHRLAMAAIAPARHQVNGKFGLRWVRGGFGTPFFGDDVQIRVLGDRLVVERAGAVEETAITTIGAAASAIGSSLDTDVATENDSPPIGAIDEVLAIDPDHAAAISEWWGLGTAALEIVRNDPATADPGRVQLWPGHFDVGVEFGSSDARASFGASPGDHGHDEPYLYVSAWWPDRLELEPSDYWNATGFTGATVPASALVGVADPVAAAVAFYTEGRDLLAAATKDS